MLRHTTVAIGLMVTVGFAFGSRIHAKSGATAMVEIPSGPFQMGSDTGSVDERPAHQVALGVFWIDRTPVTNAQYAEFLNAVGPVNNHVERRFDVEDHDARIHQHGGM